MYSLLAVAVICIMINAEPECKAKTQTVKNLKACRFFVGEQYKFMEYRLPRSTPFYVFGKCIKFPKMRKS